jgi:hypothetical protein
MLCDELAHDPDLRKVIIGFSGIQKKILAAEKFILAPDFALAADGLVENYKELERIIPWCRLPHPLCWFEISHWDRKLWTARSELHFPGEQFPPSRIGYLMEASNADCSEWVTYLLWSLKNVRPDDPDWGTKNISDGVVIYNSARPAGQKLEKYIDLGLAPIRRRYRNLDHTPEHIAELIRSDWAGEIRYVVAILGLINAKNVAETAPAVYRNLVKMNKKRVQAKKYPLSEHTVLKIRAIHKRSLVHQGEGAPGEIRGRFVRGHFKTRKTGIFWWSRHWRGPHEEEYKPKPYKVTV